MKKIKTLILLTMSIVFSITLQAQTACQVRGFQANIDPAGMVHFDIDTSQIQVSSDSVHFIIYSANGAYWYCSGTVQAAYQTLLSSSGTVADNSTVCLFQQLFQSNNIICSDSVCITVSDNINDAPIAQSDYFTTGVNTTTIIDVLANDYDPNGDPLATPIIFIPPTHGTITVLQQNSIIYTPDPNFIGCDSFQYMVCDTTSANMPRPLCDSAFAIICVDTTTISPCSFGASVNQIAGTTIYTANVVNGDSSSTYSYYWNTGDTTQSIQFNLPSATYCVTITNSNGCSASACSNPSGCSLSIIINNLGGVPNPVLEAFVTSPNSVAPFNYIWNTGQIGSSISITSMGAYMVTVTDANGCSGVATLYYNGNCFDTICGIAFNDLNGNGVFDGNDQPKANVLVYAGNYFAYTDINGHYEITIPCGQFFNTISAYPNDSNSTPSLVSIPSTGIYTIDSTIGGVRNCGYDFAFSSNYIYVQGTIYIDANNNATFDFGENGVSYQAVQVGSQTTYTDYDGNYSILLPLGTYPITYSPSGWYAGASATPVIGYSIVGNTAGQTYYNNNFGISIPAGSVNLAVNITPHTTITPGFPAWYDIEVCNVGALPTGGTVNLFYDAALTFNYASPAQSSQNSSAHTVSWNQPLLNPGDCSSYWVTFNASSSIQLGSSTLSLTNVIPSSGSDINMSNNIDTVHQIAVGSWDPNNKLAENTNYITPDKQYISSVNADQKIDYVINFQNTGTAAAVNIVVKDFISSDLEASTLQITGSSHPFTAQRNGNELIVKFSQIMLPDMTTNEPASHGFINFSINAKNNLPIGHLISDNAAIYFDYNTPVVTNNAEVTLIGSLGIHDDAIGASILLQPNPMQTYTKIKLSNTNIDGFEFSLYDMLGHQVMQKSTVDNSLTIEKESLPTGIYTYYAKQSNQMIAKGKLIVQ